MAQTPRAAANSKTKWAKSIIVLHPFAPIAILYARFTELPSTDVLLVDFSVSVEAITMLGHKSLRNPSSL
jgi:hypothetical protein